MGGLLFKPNQGKIYIAPNTGGGIAPQRQVRPAVRPVERIADDPTSYQFSSLGVPMMTAKEEARLDAMEAFQKKVKENEKKQKKAERTAAGAVMSKAEPVKITTKPYKPPVMFGKKSAKVGMTGI